MMIRHLPARQARGARSVERQVFALSLALALTTPSVAHAQRERAAFAPPRPADVALALVSRMTEARAGDIALVRRSPSGGDTIFVAADSADGEVLASAVFVLLASRQLMGSVLEAPMALRVPRRQVPSAWREKEIGRASRVLERARKAAPLTLAGWGTARVSRMRITDRRMLSHIRWRP